MATRKTLNSKQHCVMPAPEESLKELARSVGMRAIHYSNGRVRIRSPNGVQDFLTRDAAKKYLDSASRET
jgi:hypothetical protein